LRPRDLINLAVTAVTIIELLAIINIIKERLDCSSFIKQVNFFVIQGRLAIAVVSTD